MGKQLWLLLLSVIISATSSHSSKTFTSTHSQHAALPSHHQFSKTMSMEMNAGQEPRYTFGESQYTNNFSPELLAQSTSNSKQNQQQSQKSCQMIKKPMPVYEDYSGLKQMMMTCYVCGDQNGYGHYSEDCKYVPPNNNKQESYSQTTQHHTQLPQNNYRQNHQTSSNNYSSDRLKPQETTKTNSYNERKPEIKCKTVLRGHMKCKVCGDPQTDAIFSEQCGYENINPGHHGMQTYGYSNVNEQTYSNPYDLAAFNSYIPDYDNFGHENGRYGGANHYNVEGSSTGQKQVTASPHNQNSKNNCKTIYKEMNSNFDSYTTFKPKMKCEVCVRSDGYGGVTEECNYSNGNEMNQGYSSPSSFDYSNFRGIDNFYSPLIDNDYFGDYVY
ncbi:hypothetical protein CHUAL_002216 [Chamberlinius hualienensis]